MFHASTDKDIKDYVIESITWKNGRLRVIICTSALGCGVDCYNIKYVLHFGLHYSLVEYCQQIGRAGRNNESGCHAILFKYTQRGKDISASDIKEYSSTLTCLRAALFTPFQADLKPIPSLQPPHMCCSACSLACNCGLLDCFQGTDFFALENLEIADNVNLIAPIIRTVNGDDESNIKEKLEQLYLNSVVDPITVP